jgi:sterol desaturase/sphingolipid hydroxylase (fatty acid hydroxylase superfamily)
LFIQILLTFIAVDFLSYWIHRAYHRFPFLWSFHVMHHTSEQVDWLSTLRLHPVSQMIDTALIAGSLLLAGLPLRAVVAANALIGFSAVLTHANVPWTFGPLGRLFVSPAFHHWHHARQEQSSVPTPINFGAALSIWDRVFGTWMPAKIRPTRFGADDAPGQNLWNLLFQPLRFCLRRKQRKS